MSYYNDLDDSSSEKSYSSESSDYSDREEEPQINTMPETNITPEPSEPSETSEATEPSEIPERTETRQTPKTNDTNSNLGDNTRELFSELKKVGYSFVELLIENAKLTKNLFKFGIKCGRWVNNKFNRQC